MYIPSSPEYQALLLVALFAISTAAVPLIGRHLPSLYAFVLAVLVPVIVRLALERRLSQGPVLLVVEDLHWADAASLEGLRTMADWLADGPLVVVHTYRPTFDARHVVTSRTTHVALRLRPLTFDESHTLLGALFGPSTTRIPDSVRELIVKRAGGNPLYLEEIVRDLGLAYRVVVLPAGDMSTSMAKTYDVEIWFPSQGRYRETASISNTTDFQARRLGIRFRGEHGPEPVHTLNGTAVVDRMALAILENFQGDVPDVLRDVGAPERIES